MKRSQIPRVSAKMRAKKAIYHPLAEAYLKKYFLCMIDLAEKGFDPSIEPVVMEGNALAGKWLEGTLAWFPANHIKRSRDVHHKAGRIGANLIDQSTWMAVSRTNHDRIHLNPSWARGAGYLK